MEGSGVQSKVPNVMLSMRPMRHIVQNVDLCSSRSSGKRVLEKPQENFEMQLADLTEMLDLASN